MFKIKRFEKTQLAEEEREGLESEIRFVRLKLAETQDSLKVTTNRAANLEEELAAIRGETEGYTAKVRSMLVKVFFYIIPRFCSFIRGLTKLTSIFRGWVINFVYIGYLNAKGECVGRCCGALSVVACCNHPSTMYLSNWCYSRVWDI